MANEFEEEFFFELRYKPDIIKTKIFDKVFIDNNKDKIKIIYKKKEYGLQEYFEDINPNINRKDLIIFNIKN